jgi:hypothetical protein
MSDGLSESFFAYLDVRKKMGAHDVLAPAIEMPPLYELGFPRDSVNVPELKALYGFANGAERVSDCFFPGRGHFLSLAEAQEWIAEMILMSEGNERSWSPYWFPFAIELGGGFTVIECGPRNSGSIKFVHGQFDPREVAGSLAQYFCQMADEISSGGLIYVQKLKSFLRPG